MRTGLFEWRIVFAAILLSIPAGLARGADADPAIMREADAAIATYTSGQPYTGYLTTDLNGDTSTSNDFAVGVTGRNTFRQPGWYNINLAIAKYFPINERFKLQFRTEFYNALNHSNYYVQTNQADAGFFGSNTPFAIVGKKGVNPAIGIPNERRFIQMALRLTF